MVKREARTTRQPTTKHQHTKIADATLVISEKDLEDDRVQDFIDKLEAGLSINENRLDESLIGHPDLFFRVSKELALLTSRRDAAKQMLEYAEASADIRIREKYAEGDKKITESGIRIQVRLDPEVKAAELKRLRLDRAVNQLMALKEAYIQRSYVLKDMVALHVSNHYSDPSNGSSAARRAMRDERQRRSAE